MTIANPLRVAVLIDTYDGPHVPAIKDSFTTSIQSASPTAQIDFYDPIEAQIYPDPASYELIVLSGGTENMTGPVSSHLPWVQKMQEFLRSTAQAWPKKKIMGICWGHQIICVSFGGVVEAQVKSELGVTTVPLKPAGTAFLTGSELHIHEFHKRKVTTAAPGFQPLAENGQSFINDSNTIISFQGHPEMNTQLAKSLLKDAPSYMCVEGEEKDAVYKTMEKDHDGRNIWKRVVQWVGEE